MKKMSVIIPFLNEVQEVIDTLDDLDRKCDISVLDIIVIDDGTPISWKERLIRFGVRYVRNEVRLGVALSRDLGTYLAQCDKAIILDAHMRFLDSSWIDRMCEEIEKDPSSLYCAACVPLSSESSHLMDSSLRGYYGARLELITKDKGNASEILEPKWEYGQPTNVVQEVQCVLGASYAFDVKTFQKLRGLEGLMSWGGDEPYISLKYWLSGGSCKVVSDVPIGHIFRKTAPYSNSIGHLYFNKMFICSTVLPNKIALRLIDLLPRDVHMEWAVEEFRRKAGQIFEYRRYYDGLFKRSFQEVCDLIGLRATWNV